MASKTEEWAGERPALFQWGPFTLHSGGTSSFKIECDALTDGDWRTLAHLLAERIGPVDHIAAVPRGGFRLADALASVVTWVVGGPILIVDDVLTTGASMEAARRRYIETGEWREIRGAVVFARGPVPAWITPLFTLTPEPAR